MDGPRAWFGRHKRADKLNTATDLIAMLEQAVAQADPSYCPTLIGEVERLKALLWLRLSASTQSPNQAADRLLTVAAAADKLSLTKDYLYRHASTFPFTVRAGRHRGSPN
jgi:hypothetical protein